MVATDRISAFDVVLPEGIPYKGQMLNQIAAKFLDATKMCIRDRSTRISPRSAAISVPRLKRASVYFSRISYSSGVASPCRY